MAVPRIPTITRAVAREPFLIDFELDDGRSGTLDASYLVDGSAGTVFEPLAEFEAFRRVRAVESHLEWPGGQDLCVDTLVAALRD